MKNLEIPTFDRSISGFAEFCLWLAEGQEDGTVFEVDDGETLHRHAFISYVGMCTNASTFFDWMGEQDYEHRSIISDQYFHCFVPSYPDFSGDILCPVPLEGEEAGFAYFSIENKWIGQYGENRKAFCKWVGENVVDFFKKHLDEGDERL